MRRRRSTAEGDRGDGDSVAMTPREMEAAFWSFINGGDQAEFFRLCDQLRSGELTMTFTDEGYEIRASEGEPGS